MCRVLRGSLSSATTSSRGTSTRRASSIRASATSRDAIRKPPCRKSRLAAPENGDFAVPNGDSPYRKRRLAAPGTETRRTEYGDSPLPKPRLGVSKTTTRGARNDDSRQGVRAVRSGSGRSAAVPAGRTFTAALASASDMPPKPVSAAAACAGGRGLNQRRTTCSRPARASTPVSRSRPCRRPERRPGVRASPRCGVATGSGAGCPAAAGCAAAAPPRRRRSRVVPAAQAAQPGRVADELAGVQLDQPDHARAGQRDLHPVVAVVAPACGLPALAHHPGRARARCRLAGEE